MPLSEMTIDTRVSEPDLQKLYPIVMKHHKWVKDEINKHLTAKVIQGSKSIWSATIIVVPKRDGGKCLVMCSTRSHKNLSGLCGR